MKNTNIPTLNSKTITTMKRNIKTPFRVNLAGFHQQKELICTRVVRILPGKRLVGFGELNGEKIVAKFFVDPNNAWKHCAREERGLKSLKKIGIKIPELIFKGELEPDSTPVLILKKIEPTFDFSETWDSIKNEQERVVLLKRLILIIALEHEAGLRQNDIHLGNFLVKDNDIFSIDGADVDVRHADRSLPVKKSLDNLGLFFAQFLPEFDNLMEIGFKEYIKIRKWQAFDDLYDRLVKSTRHNRKIRKNKYLRKIYRECSEYMCQKSWNSFLVLSREYRGETMNRLLSDPDLAIKNGQMLKDGGASTVALVNINGIRLVIKRYNRKSIGHFIKRTFRHSRAYISWRNAHRLAMLGISSNKPVALLERRLGPFCLTAYYISEYIEGPDAYNLLHSKEVDQNDTQQIACWFRELMQRFADEFISHGDLKATNVIVTENGLSVIDLDAMREHRYKYWFLRAFKKDIKRLLKNWDDLPRVCKIFHKELKTLKTLNNKKYLFETTSK